MDQSPQDNVTEHSGFPNPATDSTLMPLDIGALLIKHPASTFFMSIASDTWEHMGIFKNDIAIIDRALSPKHSDMVIWWADATFTMSRFSQLPPNSTIWGVVTNIVHRYRI